jgi:RNA polymerase sigma factor (sigma-70 family)
LPDAELLSSKCVVRVDEGYNHHGMSTASIPAGARPALPVRSKRLLALASDERLVEHIRRGNEAAFEVAFERYGAALLSFCRHMLQSLSEAEDAVQHTFAAAYRDLLRDQRAIRLKPWLFTIARNRCLSMLRARREEPVEQPDLPTAGLAEEVEQRAELRELLGDLQQLPAQQRAALLLAELADLSHADVADVLGCEVPRVKALVFRARSGLMERRDARETPCEQIREQLANLRGGALRRSGLRHHLRACPGCREYRDHVQRQRRLLAAALPVTPSLGLKSSVLGGLGIGGGSAGGGGALLGGMSAAASGSLTATAAKLAVIGVVAGGGAVAGESALKGSEAGRPEATPAAQGSAPAAMEPHGSAPAARREATPAKRAGVRRRAAPRERRQVRREPGARSRGAAAKQHGPAPRRQSKSIGHQPAGGPNRGAPKAPRNAPAGREAHQPGTQPSGALKAPELRMRARVREGKKPKAPAADDVTGSGG